MQQYPSIPSLGQRLRYVRKLKGLSQADLAVRAGCTQGAVGNIERNLRIGRGETLMNIAEVLEVPYRWLKEGVSEFKLGEEKPIGYRAFEDQKNEGAGELISLEQLPAWLGLRPLGRHHPSQGIHNDAAFRWRTVRVRVSGDSMTQNGQPHFPDGTTLLVSADRVPVAGDYVIAVDPSRRVAMFRQLSHERGDWYLKPLNADYRTIRLEDFPDQVIGVVTEYWFGGVL